MERIVEPELMEEEEQSLACAEADFEQPHNHFIYHSQTTDKALSL